MPKKKEESSESSQSSSSSVDEPKVTSKNGHGGSSSAKKASTHQKKSIPSPKEKDRAEKPKSPKKNHSSSSDDSSDSISGDSDAAPPGETDKRASVKIVTEWWQAAKKDYAKSPKELVKTIKRGHGIKSAVSKEKRRFREDGFNLDLSCKCFFSPLDITPRIIAMGFPSSGTEAFYRNPAGKVVKWVKKYHEGHFKVYNLCAERAYNLDLFDGNVVKFGFDDHQACALTMVPNAVLLIIDCSLCPAHECVVGCGPEQCCRRSLQSR